jgi:CubicO group peptidase (beta-lactamase class C family)
VRLIPALVIASLFVYCPVLAAELPVDIGRATANTLIERAMARNMVAGAVALIGNHEGILYTTARGRLNAGADAALLNEHTIFDVASLTKVIATTPSVMKLVDEGRLNLTDPISRWFPEFKGSRREGITILQLLTHTSGLDDNNLSAEQPMKMAINRAVNQKYWQVPGSNFQYADINFILLGELVYRISGKTLDVYSRENLFEPLEAQETMFLPPKQLAGFIAPTDDTFAGVVQDRNSRRLGGVAGHAGLFTSAYDLSRFARMMLGGGTLDGKRILSEQAVSQMTAPQFFHKGAIVRGLGWDMDSPFSAPKGNYFSEASFGHTGYSGSSIWIDPKQDLFVILLTIRLDYRDVKTFNQLRRDVSTFAATDFWKFRSFMELPPLETLADANMTGPGSAAGPTMSDLSPRFKMPVLHPKKKHIAKHILNLKKSSRKMVKISASKRTVANRKGRLAARRKLLSWLPNALPYNQSLNPVA